MHAIVVTYEDGDTTAIGPYPDRNAAFVSLPGIVRELLESDDDDELALVESEIQRIAETGDASDWGVSFRIAELTWSWPKEATTALAEALAETVGENDEAIRDEPEEELREPMEEYVDRLNDVRTSIGFLRRD